MPAKKNPASLETSMKDLEKLIDKMENKELPLEESLTCFEKGIKLVSDCQKVLKETEQRVKILLKENGQESLEDFIDDDD